MNSFEHMIVHNRARWYLQRFWEIPILKNLGLDLEGKHILEIGCGTGHAAYQLSTRYKAATVTAIDLDANIVEQAKKRYPNRDNLTFHCGDATRLPFDSGSFDVILSFGLLHHIPVWQTVVQEAHRVLKKSGVYALDDFTSHALKKKYHTIFDHPRHNRFDTGQLVSCFKSNFFQVCDLTHRVAGDVIFMVARKV